MMFMNLSMPLLLGLIVVIAVAALWANGTFSTRKQYRNKDRFSLEGIIQKNLTDLNIDQINNQASNKFHFDNIVTDVVLDNGKRLDSLYAQKKYTGPYGISTRAAKLDKDVEVVASAKDLEPTTVVEVDASQVKPMQEVIVKKENVIASAEVVVKAKDVKPGERVIVKPAQVRPRQQVLKKSTVSGESQLVAKEDVDLNEDVVADSSQLDPEEDIVVKASQVKPNKSVVTQGKSLASDKKVTVEADKLKPEEVVIVKASDTKPTAEVKPVVSPASTPKLAVPAASDGIELEVPEPLSLNNVENRLGSDASFGKLYSMNKQPARKAYSTVSSNISLDEFPVRSTVHTSRI
jgi:hypothetical protein